MTAATGGDARAMELVVVPSHMVGGNLPVVVQLADFADNIGTRPAHAFED